MKRRLFLATILSTVAASQAVAFFDHDHDEHGKQKGGDRDHDDGDRSPRHGQAHLRYFRPDDRVILSRYYPVQTLPPGLRKKTPEQELFRRDGKREFDRYQWRWWSSCLLRLRTARGAT